MLSAFLDSLQPTTRDAYARDLSAFALFLGAPDTASAVRQLMTGTLGDANALALTFRTHLVARGLAFTSVNRKLASLRAVVGLARTLRTRRLEARDQELPDGFLP